MSLLGELSGFLLNDNEKRLKRIANKVVGILLEIENDEYYIEDYDFMNITNITFKGNGIYHVEVPVTVRIKLKEERHIKSFSLCFSIILGKSKIASVQYLHYKLGRSIINRYDNDLVACLNKDGMEEIAKRFLKEYFREGLETPMPIPIETIAREKLKLDIKELSITEDLSILGEMYFTDGISEFYFEKTDEFLPVNVKAGDMFLDKKLIEENTGRRNLTIAHEVIHWYFHRLRFVVQAQLTEEKAFATKSVSQKGKNYFMELQAERIGAAILMPEEVFRDKAYEFYKRLKLNVNMVEDREKLIKKLAIFFEVSNEAARMRCEILGIL